MKQDDKVLIKDLTLGEIFENFLKYTNIEGVVEVGDIRIDVIFLTEKGHVRARLDLNADKPPENCDKSHNSANNPFCDDENTTKNIPKNRLN